MLKCSIYTGALLLLAAYGAQAADFTVSESPTPAQNYYDWSGFYVGAHGGYSWFKSEYDHIETTGVGGPPINFEHFSVSPSGLSGGLQAGYQHQFDRFVLGAEVEYTWYDADARAFTDLNGIDRYRETEIDEAWSVAARAGYAWDRTLGYVKAGYSNAKLNYTNTRIDTGRVVGYSSDRVDGFVIGTGVEHALTDNIIIGAEYAFTKYSVGDQQQLRDGVPVWAFNDDNKLDNHTINLRVNYKF